MSWTRSLQPASFRGVAFGVFGAGKDFGRRKITHLFPLRDKPFHEDMGLGPRAFTLDAFLVGDDVVSRVRRLEAAIEAKGPGRLIHPHYGALTVEALKARTDFVAFEGRVARVQIAFEEAGTAAAPAGFLNAVASLLARISETVDAVLGDALSIVSIAGELAYVVEGVASDIRAIGSALVGRTIAGGFAGRSAALGAVVEPLSGQAETIPAALGILSATTADDLGDGSAPMTLAARTISALALVEPAAIGGFASDPDPRITVVDALLRAGGDLPASSGVPSTVSRAVLAANRDALSFLLQASAVLAACRAATAVQWDSRDQLLAYGASVADALEAAADLAGALGLDTAWRSLGDAGTSWASFVAATSPPLQTVATVTPIASVAASLLAYRLDGDALSDVFDRGGSIARRNAVRHPGFILGGLALEVVGNG